MASAGGHWVKLAQANSGKLVFVPKGQTLAEAVVGKPASKAAFPADPGSTSTIKTLGGSTGAKLVQDDAGNLYVKKTGGNAGHVREESVADNAYRALGLDVPEHTLFETSAGPVKLARYVEGETLAHAINNNPAAANVAKESLRKGFIADALLGNWDVVGLGQDNVLVGKDGKTYRIDNGGALRYRAMGALKGADKFTGFPTEVFTMRNQGTAGQIFGSLSWKQVAQQASSFSKKFSALQKTLPNELKPVMRQRADRIKQLSLIHKTLSAKGYGDNSIEAYTKKLWSALSTGKTAFDPKTAADVLKSFEVVGG